MAIAMQRRMRELEQEWRSRGLLRPFRIRMGITTGFCTVGNFGSRDRMDYTIIGNEVNLAARLQSATEPGSILLSHETNALVQGLVMTEEQPPITVKGFPKPISGYKLVGTYNDLVKDGRVVLEERDGLHVLVDLTKQDRSDVIEILQDILTQLRRPSGGGRKATGVGGRRKTLSPERRMCDGRELRLMERLPPSMHQEATSWHLVGIVERTRRSGLSQVRLGSIADMGATPEQVR